MAPLRGWAPRGQRLIGKVPHGHWKTGGIAPRSDRGPLASRFPDRWRDLANLEAVLVPTLRAGDIVVMDNFGSALLLGQKLPGASSGYIHPEHLIEHLRPFMQALEDRVFSARPEALPP